MKNIGWPLGAILSILIIHLVGSEPNTFTFMWFGVTVYIWLSSNYKITKK